MNKSMKRAQRKAHNRGEDSMSVFESARLASSPVETKEERVRRLYSYEGGALMGWLLDECRIRGFTLQALAAELGVTYGYLNQLRSGLREISQVGPRFAQRAARFLGVPTVVVKLMAGQLTMSDFIPPQQTEEEFVERAMIRLLEDSKASSFISLDRYTADIAVKKDFLSLYAEVSGDDIYNMKELPEMLRWLQLAAVEHSENVLQAERAHGRQSALALAA